MLTCLASDQTVDDNYVICSTDMLSYSFSTRLNSNITNITSNVNFSPTTLDQLDGFSLVDYTMDNVCFMVYVTVCVTVCVTMCITVCVPCGLYYG